MFSSASVKTSSKNKYKTSEKTLAQKLLFTSIILIMLQFLSQIPIWGINRELISYWLDSDISNIFGVFNIFSGMSFENLSFFALGIAPYISASIILQLLRVAITPLDQMCKDAQNEKKFVEKITYVFAVIIGILQVIPLVMNFSNSGLLINDSFSCKLLVGVSILVGSAIMIALGKVIENKGIGNGISLILLMNILASMRGDFINIYNAFIYQKEIFSIVLTIIISLVVLLASFIIVIYLHEGKKDIRVTFAGRMQGGKTVKSADNTIPLKVNMSGVMPVIFASTLIQIVPMVVTLFNVATDSIIYEIAKYFNQMYWFNFGDIKYTAGVIIYFVLIVFFSYFYNMISFSAKDIADNLNKQGGTIAGIRPGKSTKDYLDNQVKYMILLGSLILIVISVIPMIVGGIIGMNLAFGGTSIIIVVSVLLETYKTIKLEKQREQIAPKRYSVF